LNYIKISIDARTTPNGHQEACHGALGPTPRMPTVHT